MIFTTTRLTRLELRGLSPESKRNYLSEDVFGVILDPECLISEEDGCIEIAGRDTIYIDYLFGSGFALEWFVVQTDHSLRFEDIFDLVVIVFEPLVIEAFLHKLSLFSWVFEWGQPVSDIGRDGEWRLLISEAHFDGMRSQLQHDGLASLVLQFVDVVAFCLQVLYGVLHGLFRFSHGDDYT